METCLIITITRGFLKYSQYRECHAAEEVAKGSVVFCFCSDVYSQISSK